MLYFMVNGNKTVFAIAEKLTGDRKDWECRVDWKTFAQAELIANNANVYSAVDGSQARYEAIDNGPGCYPQYDVVAKFLLREIVSYGFNGDYYPDGEIASISKTEKVITTTTGSRYYRQGKNGRYVKNGGTWGLVHGYHKQQNPCF